MTQPPRRRPASSRTTTSRPRRVAGRSAPEVEQDAPRAVPAAPVEPSEPDEPTASAEVADATDAETAALPASEDGDGHRDDDDAVVPGATGADGPSTAGLLASERLTVALLGALALVLVAGLALAGTVLYAQFRGDDDATDAAEVPAGQVAVPDGRPVTINELAWQEGVDAAAKAAQEIVAVNFEKYDAEVDAAAELMTDDFAETYRQTAGDVRQQIVDRETVVQASIAAQGVVRANETELQALIFLNQFVKREDEDGPTNVITPYKVLVTMVHTDDGWFVDSLDTDDAAPATDGQPPTEQQSPPAGEQSPAPGE